MKEILFVFAGGGAGSVIRYAISRLSSAYSITFPWATLCSNFLSSFILSIIVAIYAPKINDLSQSTVYLLLVTGFCGGFSTFSTFSYETIKMFQHGQSYWAIGNILLNLILCILAVWIGLKMGKIA